MAHLDRPLSARRPSELVFDLYPISYVFKAGPQIRVTVVNAAGDAFQPPPARSASSPPTIAIWRGNRCLVHNAADHSRSSWTTVKDE
ncbi:MAG: hypothetical protein JNJ73_03490 [Hyphomonadaceae bacterium]|nr:hypothetical protein [Hyphomonadaceae bacterium]